MTTSVRHIVDDVDESIEFYRDRLRFDLEMNPAPGFAVLSRGDLRLLLNAPGASGAGRAGGSPEPGGWSRFQLELEDLDQIVNQLEQKGTTFRGEMVEGKGGRQVNDRRPLRKCRRTPRTLLDPSFDQPSSRLFICL